MNFQPIKARQLANKDINTVIAEMNGWLARVYGGTFTTTQVRLGQELLVYDNAGGKLIGVWESESDATSAARGALIEMGY